MKVGPRVYISRDSHITLAFDQKCFEKKLKTHPLGLMVDYTIVIKRLLKHKSKVFG